MYVARALWPSSNGKTYQSIYLRESYRDGPHVRKRNIANLTHCDPQEIAAIELALRCKGELGRPRLPRADSTGPGSLGRCPVGCLGSRPAFGPPESAGPRLCRPTGSVAG